MGLHGLRDSLDSFVFSISSDAERVRAHAVYLRNDVHSFNRQISQNKPIAYTSVCRMRVSSMGVLHDARVGRQRATSLPSQEYSPVRDA
jgi:hypothetical protein